MRDKDAPSLIVDNIGMQLRLDKDQASSLKELFLGIGRKKPENKKEFWALRNISFTVKPGERLAIFGLNGSGKSTLLKIISDVYVPTEGKVVKNGSIAPLLELGAGFCGQYTAEENIYLYGAVLGYPRDYLKDMVEEIIAFAELEEFMHVPVKKYSSGMKARLGFSICTSVHPDILLLDEILSVGDMHFREKSEKKLIDMMDGSTSVLFVTHSMEQARRICSRAIILEKGRLVGEGTVDEMAECYREKVQTIR